MCHFIYLFMCHFIYLFIYIFICLFIYLPYDELAEVKICKLDTSVELIS